MMSYNIVIISAVVSIATESMRRICPINVIPREDWKKLLQNQREQCSKSDLMSLGHLSHNYNALKCK